MFAALLTGLTLLAYFVPYYDWDLVAYTGAAIALHEQNPATIQSEAYSALRRELPEDDYEDIANGSAFRRDVASNPSHFSQQLRFYQIRPLYIRLLALMRTAGIGYVLATRVLSGTAFFLTGILLFKWAANYIPEWKSAICVPLLMITPVLFTSARTGSSDALSAFVVMLGVYLAIERRHLPLAAAFLLLSLFLRTDNVIFVFLLLASLVFTQSRPSRRVFAGGLAVLSLAIVFAINRTEHSYSWPVLMQNTTNPIVNPAEIAPAFTPGDYLSALGEMLDEAGESSMIVFPFIAAAALLSRRLSRQWRGLIQIVLLSWAAHILLFPHIEDRYFVAGSAIIGIGALLALLPNRIAGDAAVQPAFL